MHFSKKLTKKSKKLRGALIYLALFGVAPMAFGAETETRYVSDYNGLRAAISEYNESTGANYKIVLTGNVTLQGELPVITGNADLVGIQCGTLSIDGAGYSINGAGAYRGLYIDSDEADVSISVSSLQFANCYAKGGDGGEGASSGGGGMGAGAAIYAYSGDVVLKNVTVANSTAIGGDGGSVLYGSQSYGAGGGLGGNGGSGQLLETGAANGGGIYSNGADSTSTASAGDGGVVSKTDLESYAHTLPDTTTPEGGNSLAGGGGGASTANGGAGGFGGGGGAGAHIGGAGGFGGGGAGGDSSTTAGKGGFAAGDGGYVDPVSSTTFSSTPGGGVGGGGAALGGAIFVGENANLVVDVSENSFSEIYGGTIKAGQAGGGSAQDGEAIGKGIFLLNDLTIQVAEGGTYVVSDSIGGYAGSSKIVADENGNYENTSGVIKTGDGTLVLNATDSSYSGDTTVKGGTLVANVTGAISSYSGLNVEEGTVNLNAGQTVRNLNGGTTGSIDLNSQTLTVSGDGEDGVYAGKFVGPGKIVKNGDSALTLAGDSRDPDGEKVFDTVLNGGTIRVKNDGAFGDGKVFYTRSDSNDQTASLDFADGITLANDIVLDGNSNPLILAGGSATLNGKITANNNSNKEIVFRLNDGANIHLTNTGLVTDEDGNTTYVGGNSIAQLTLETGGIVVDVDSYADDEGRYWYSSLGNADIVSNSDSNLAFVLNTDDANAGLRFSNNLITNSGYLTIDPVTLDGTTTQVKDIYAEGTTSGNGGLRIDVGAGATYNVLGALQQAYTDVNSGTLNLANVSTNNAFVGGLSSSGNGTVDVGAKNLVVDFDNGDLTYSGRIVGNDGANINKLGSGAWTMNLNNNSDVNSVNVEEGTLSLGENHYESGMYASNDFAIVLGPQGVFKHSTTSGETITLNNLDASRGGAIVIGDKDELELSGKNTSTTIAANLNGNGWLLLDNVKDASGEVTPWTLSGDNSNWGGVVAAYDAYAKLNLASENATSVNSEIKLGSHGTVNVLRSNKLGSLDFDDNATINVNSGKNLELGKLSSNVLWLKDSVLTIDGGGNVVLVEKAASDYLGATKITNGSTLTLKGDNTTTGKRGVATLTNGGAIAMDYTGVSSSEPLASYWGSEIDVEGEGTIRIANSNSNGPVLMDETIGFVGTLPGTLDFDVVAGKVQLDGIVDGSGTLVKDGSGLLILNGSGVFADVLAKEGVLQLGTSESKPNTQLTYANLAIDGGSVTGWTNSLGSVSLNSGSLKLDTTKTVNLTGSGSVFSMDGGNLYINVVDKDNYTSFKATDSNATAEMKGGTIYVDTDTYGANLSVGDSITVVDVNPGNLTANPSNFSIYDNYAGMRFVVDTSKLSDGYFNLLLKKASFSEFARTPNEISVAGYLDKWQDGPRWDSQYDDFFTSLENAVEKNPGVLNQLTGELRFSALNAQVQSRNLMRQTLTRNVLPSPTLTPCRGVNTCCSSAIRGQSWNYDAANQSAGLAGWASMFGAGGSAESLHSLSGYDYSQMGGMFGIELGGTASNQAGLYYAYNNVDVDSKSAMGDVEFGDNVFGIYGRFTDDYGYTFATGSLGVANYDISRAVSFGSGTHFFEGDTDGWSGSAYLERGFTFCLPASSSQLYGGLQYTYLEMDGFTETGTYSPIALRTTDTDYNSFQGVIGLRWLKSIVGPQSAFDFTAYANWTHEFLDESVEGDLAMIAGPNRSFHIVGNGSGRDWVYAGLGGDWLLSDNFDLFGGADVQVSSHTTYVFGNGGFRVKW